MIRPRGKASRIYYNIFSMNDSSEKKERVKERVNESRSSADKRMNELISRDISLNERPKNS